MIRAGVTKRGDAILAPGSRSTYVSRSLSPNRMHAEQTAQNARRRSRSKSSRSRVGIADDPKNAKNDKNGKNDSSRSLRSLSPSRAKSLERGRIGGIGGSNKSLGISDLKEYLNVSNSSLNNSKKGLYDLNSDSNDDDIEEISYNDSFKQAVPSHHNSSSDQILLLEPHLDNLNMQPPSPGSQDSPKSNQTVQPTHATSSKGQTTSTTSKGKRSILASMKNLIHHKGSKNDKSKKQSKKNVTNNHNNNPYVRHDSNGTANTVSTADSRSSFSTLDSDSQRSFPFFLHNSSNCLETVDEEAKSVHSADSYGDNEPHEDEEMFDYSAMFDTDHVEDAGLDGSHKRVTFGVAIQEANAEDESSNFNVIETPSYRIQLNRGRGTLGSVTRRGASVDAKPSEKVEKCGELPSSSSSRSRSKSSSRRSKSSSGRSKSRDKKEKKDSKSRGKSKEKRSKSKSRSGKEKKEEQTVPAVPPMQLQMQPVQEPSRSRRSASVEPTSRRRSRSLVKFADAMGTSQTSLDQRHHPNQLTVIPQRSTSVDPRSLNTSLVVSVDASDADDVSNLSPPTYVKPSHEEETHATDASSLAYEVPRCVICRSKCRKGKYVTFCHFHFCAKDNQSSCFECARCRAPLSGLLRSDPENSILAEAQVISNGRGTLIQCGNCTKEQGMVVPRVGWH